MGVFQKLFARVLGLVDPNARRLFDVHKEIQEQKKAAKGTTGRTGVPSPGYKLTNVKGMEPLEGMPLSPDLQAAIAEEKKKQDEYRRRQQEDERRRDPAWGFVNAEHPLVRGIDFTSSNVQWIQFDKQSHTLFIEYGSGHKTDGRTYRYDPISEDLARRFFDAVSKGTLVWDELRLRGTILGHKVNYSLVSGGMEMPRWTHTAQSRTVHEERVGEESGTGGPHPVFQLGAMYGPPAPITPPYRAIGRFTL